MKAAAKAKAAKAKAKLQAGTAKLQEGTAKLKEGSKEKLHALRDKVREKVPSKRAENLAVHSLPTPMLDEAYPGGFSGVADIDSPIAHPAVAPGPAAARAGFSFPRKLSFNRSRQDSRQDSQQDSQQDSLASSRASSAADLMGGPPARDEQMMGER